MLRAWKLGHVSDDAVLLVGELATNVVAHAAQGIGEYFELALRRRDGVLVLEVSDSYQWEMPELRKPGPEETSGRGLLLVDALSQAGGVRPPQRGGQNGVGPPRCAWVRGVRGAAHGDRWHPDRPGRPQGIPAQRPRRELTVPCTWFAEG